MIKTNVRQYTAGMCRFMMALLAVTMMVGSALAQTETGQINGKVVDPAGAVVAGASVTVKSVQTGREVTATSDNQGGYTVTSLQSGLYDVTTTGSN